MGTLPAGLKAYMAAKKAGTAKPKAKMAKRSSSKKKK